MQDKPFAYMHVSRTKLTYPEKLSEVQLASGVWFPLYANPFAVDKRTPSNVLVNGGALKLALNVLRRAGKYEIAGELENTITYPDKM